jgi:hypothetical protein
LKTHERGPSPGKKSIFAAKCSPGSFGGFCGSETGELRSYPVPAASKSRGFNPPCEAAYGGKRESQTSREGLAKFFCKLQKSLRDKKLAHKRCPKRQRIYIDSIAFTRLRKCTQKKHRVFRGTAQWAYSSTGAKLGLKMHLFVDGNSG